MCLAGLATHRTRKAKGRVHRAICRPSSTTRDRTTPIAMKWEPRNIQSAEGKTWTRVAYPFPNRVAILHRQPVMHVASSCLGHLSLGRAGTIRVPTRFSLGVNCPLVGTTWSGVSRSWSRLPSPPRPIHHLGYNVRPTMGSVVRGPDLNLPSARHAPCRRVGHPVVRCDVHCVNTSSPAPSPTKDERL